MSPFAVLGSVEGTSPINPFVADPEWGWWIIFYFYLGGLAAGSYFVAMLVELFGRDADRAVSRVGYRIAFPLVCICGLLLIADLERPERFWHMLLQSEVVDRALAEGWPLGGWGTMVQAPMFKYWSPMSIGAWALAVFGLCSSLSFLGTLWPGGRLDRLLVRSPVARLFHLFGSGVGFFVASYTGVLLTASNQPLWDLSDWLGPLFLTSAGSTGIAAVLLFSGPGGAVSEASRERLERADLWALGLELFVFLLFLASLGNVLPLALQTPAGWVLVGGTLVVGLLLPLWLHRGLTAHDPGRVKAAALAALVGGFALRFGVVRVAPELLERGDDYWRATYRVLAPDPLWGGAVLAGLLALTLALAVAIPWILRRQWRLSGRQTALAGLASLLVTAGVALYAFSPATARSVFHFVSIPYFSPEDGRPRGGGPGASASNRPQEVHLRTKLKAAGGLPHAR
jgi:protein NrfD